ncbi:MAG TPA: DUF413 domain-containing protein [Fimbriiglobus sp.]|nr:DUF413 domain-containing protein [Fimbriiglobus sp.]
MSRLPTEHTALIQRSGFPVPPDGDFDNDEHDLLSRYGYWLAALADGTLTPTTSEQQRFTQVVQGTAEPRTTFELAWAKYQRVAAPSRPRVGPMELGECLERLQSARATAVAVNDEYAARRVEIMEQVRPLLEALDGEFGDRLRETGEVVTRLEAEARAMVLSYGASFRHSGVHAVYTRARVTWDGKGLSLYLEDHPELAEFRRVGNPSVSLRFQ